MPPSDPRIGRLRWRSRRGLKELDKLLEPFFSSDLSSLDGPTLDSLERLLDCQDPQLLEWLLGRSQPHDPELRHALERISHGHA